MSQSFTSTTHFTQEDVITQQQLEFEQHSYSPSSTPMCFTNNVRKANISFNEKVTKPNCNIYPSMALDKCEKGDLSTETQENHSFKIDISGDKSNKPLSSILKKERHTTREQKEQYVNSNDNLNCTDLSNLPSSYDNINRCAQHCAVNR